MLLVLCFWWFHISFMSQFSLLLQEEEVLRTFNKQIEEDGRIVTSRSNLNELHKVISAEIHLLCR